MYAFIRGKLAEVTPTYVVIENQGIGYFINITVNTYSQIKDLKEVSLFTHLVVREDAHILYGFAKENERQLFLMLITVSGVGANTARLILSSLSTEETYTAITQGNTMVLQGVKGIGGKTAQRIIIDLRDKLIKQDIKLEKIPSGHNTLKNEALSGLLILGFNKTTAEKAVNKVLKQTEINSVELLIKEALKIL
ncbi:MAG: Holliday junction branch migration protein RuvA [Bacteroidetes bacterium]|nr:MAG: Holliday junction branch migration protein RuvA [Bacteroidota bacterium]